MDDWVELEFRDGRRAVPGYLADILARVETYRVTYEQALEFASRARVAEHLSNVQKKVISEHFKELRGF